MVPVVSNEEGSATVQVLLSGTDPEPSYNFLQEPDVFPELPIMQPFGENVDIFGHGATRTAPTCQTSPMVLIILRDCPVSLFLGLGYRQSGQIWRQLTPLWDATRTAGIREIKTCIYIQQNTLVH